jgi:hypothetical protein
VNEERQKINKCKNKKLILRPSEPVRTVITKIYLGNEPNSPVPEADAKTTELSRTE